MSFLKRRSILDELCSLWCLTKCRRKEGYKWERSQATTRQRESVVIVVYCIRSNQNDITCLFWFYSWVEMLAAKTDFPTPGDSLVQIILWLPVLLTSVSITCRMPLRFHTWFVQLELLPRALTVPSSLWLSFHFMISNFQYTNAGHGSQTTYLEYLKCQYMESFALAAGTINQTTWTMNMGTKTRPCSTKISI